MKTQFPSQWLERMKAIIPSDEWELFLKSCTKPLPKTFWKKKEITLPQDWNIKKAQKIPEAYFFQNKNLDTPLGKTLSHFCGHIYLSSLSSMLAVHVLDPQPGEVIVDTCAAPGSKTTLLSERMNNTGVIIANEIDRRRINILQDNINRLGVQNTILSQKDARNIDQYFGEEVDRVLVDAPCSNDAHGRKNSKFYGNIWNESDIKKASKQQEKLIKSAFSILREGGEMVYSTCTLAPEENESIIQNFLSQEKNAEILPIDLGNIPHHKGIDHFLDTKYNTEITQNVKRLYPHLCDTQWESECFFLARIRKKSLQKRPFPKLQTHTGFKILKKNRAAEIITRIQKQFGINKSIFQKKILIEHQDDIFLCSPDITNQLKKVPVITAGLKIYNRIKGITTEFALHIGTEATKQILQIDKSQKEKFLYGYDLNIPSDKQWTQGQEIIIKYKNYPLGHGKIVNGKIKNKLRSNLVYK